MVVLYSSTVVYLLNRQIKRPGVKFLKCIYVIFQKRTFWKSNMHMYINTWQKIIQEIISRDWPQKKSLHFIQHFVVFEYFFNLVDLLLFKLKSSNNLKKEKSHASVHKYISQEEKLCTHIYPFINSGSS